MDTLFNILYEAMTGALWLSVLASFIWGILSIILSPCHLSSIPLIIGYITTQGIISLKRTFLISFIFAVGILITIALIGLITASLGRMMGDVGNIGNYFVAAIFFIVGLYLLDVLSFNWNFNFLGKVKSKGLLSAFILGLIFGIALGPCTFAYMAPVLGIVFQTAKSNYYSSILLLSAFGLGHCSVIVLSGTMLNRVQTYLNWSEGSKTILIIKKICGVLVILGGIYLLTL